MSAKSPNWRDVVRSPLPETTRNFNGVARSASMRTIRAGSSPIKALRLPTRLLQQSNNQPEQLNKPTRPRWKICVPLTPR